MAISKVFLSYSQRDSNWARSFAKALQQRGLRVWVDSDLAPGDSHRSEMERALRESDVIVPLVSKDSFQSPWMLFEIGAAIGMGKRILAVVPPKLDISNLPFKLSSRQYLVRNSPKDTAEELAEVLEAA